MAAYKLVVSQVVFIWLNNFVLWQTGRTEIIFFVMEISTDYVI